MKDILELINENTWVCSDHHFGHNNILRFEPLRAQRAKELGYNHWEDMIVQEHNKLVKPEDTVILLGDYMFKQGTYSPEFKELYKKFDFFTITEFKELIKKYNIKSINDLVEVEFNIKEDVYV